MTKVRSWVLISISLGLLNCATVLITGRSQLSMVKKFRIDSNEFSAIPRDSKN